MKKYGRLIVFLCVTAAGPILWWMGGGNERSITLVMATIVSTFLGTAAATVPLEYPWEDE